MEELNFKLDSEINKIDVKKIIEEIDESIADKKNIDNLLLNSLRNENHDDYFALDIQSIKKLPPAYKEDSEEIIKLYNSINSIDLLKDNYSNSLKNNYLIKQMQNKIELLKNKALFRLNKISNYNDIKEEQLDVSILDSQYENMNLERKIIEEKLNSLKFFNLSTDYNNIGFEFKRQEKRLKYIKEIDDLINKYKINELFKMNREINNIYYDYFNRIKKLDKYIKVNKNFEKLKNSVYQIFIYNKEDINEVKEKYNEIFLDNTINEQICNFELLLTNINKNKKKKRD